MLISNNNNFKNNKGKRGGIYHVTNGGVLEIYNEDATNNQAEFGGIFYYQGSKIIIRNSNYHYNHVKYSGGIGYISRNSGIIDFNKNIFTFNTADETGGVFFCDKNNSKCNCIDCKFNNNKAISYGNIYASDISHLSRIKDNKIDYNKDVLYLTLGNTITQPLKIQALDKYDQIVSSPTYSGLLECELVEKPLNNTVSATITGAKTSINQRGIISFNNFGIQGIENSITPIKITCTRNELTNIISSYTENLYITILSKSCNDGQKTSKINDNIIGCIDCLNNEYLPNRGDQLCSTCPKGAICEGSSTIYAQKDWWQPSSHINKMNKDCIFPFIYKNTEYKDCINIDSNKPWCMTSNNSWSYCNYSRPIYNFYKCPILNSCLGGKSNETLLYGNNLCIEGHTGVLCGICKKGYRQGLDKLCVPCDINDNSVLSIYIVPIVVIISIIILFGIYYYINCYTKKTMEDNFKEWLDNFSLYDKNKKGKLTYKSFYKLLKYINLKINYKEVVELCKIIDINDDKYIDKKEYLLLMCKLKYADGSTEFMNKIFNDSTEYIRRSESNLKESTEINIYTLESIQDDVINNIKKDIIDLAKLEDDGSGTGIELTTFKYNTKHPFIISSEDNFEDSVKINIGVEPTKQDKVKDKIKEILESNNKNKKEVNDTIDLIENYQKEQEEDNNSLFVGTVNAYQTDTINRNISGLDNKNKLYKPLNNILTNAIQDNGDNSVPSTNLIDFNINLKSIGFDTIMSGIKIVFSHFQVICSFNTFKIEWPPLFIEIRNKFSFLNVDFLTVVPIDCIVEVNYYRGLLMSITSPILIIALIFMIGRLLEYYNPIEINTYRDFTHKIVFIFLFIIYPGITQILFEIFICTNVEGIEYLTKDLRYQCYDETWTKWSIVSYFGILIYPIGIPILFYYVLKQNENSLFKEYNYCLDDDGKKPSNIKNRYGFLYSRYKEEVYYFESVEFLRKLILVGAIMFLMPGSIMQISIAFIVSIVFFILHIKLQPFKEDSDTHLQSITLFCSSVTLFSAIMLNAVQNSKTESGYGKELFELLMPASNMLVLILMLYITFIELKSNLETISIFISETEYCKDDDEDEE